MIFMISVIIIIFNMEDYLHVCLNSLLKQSYDDFEVVCIDDASTDFSLEILDYFSKKDSRIKIYANKTKKGIKYCKNRGLEVAKGEKIIFLNADEWFSFNILELVSQNSDLIIETNLSNKISDFRSENLNFEYAPLINYNLIAEKSKDGNNQLQKKYTKHEIINKIINNDCSDITIAIKSPHPKGTTHWGELFFSKSIKKSFEKFGFNVIIQERECWYDETEFDIALVLRGMVGYNPDYSKINIMWNISHSQSISTDEYEKYDYVFIASESYAKKIKSKVNTNVHILLQCTDPDVFFPEGGDEFSDEILFVGVTRGVYRPIIKDILKTNHNVSIYGMGWEEFIDEKYVQDYFIPNEELHKYYSSCKILLNDHWEDMLQEDFPSNRLFDALSCGAFVISDNIPSAETLFEGSIVTYEDVNDLNKKIDYYLSHGEERVKLAKKGQQIVLENHTFDKRIIEIISVLKENGIND